MATPGTGAESDTPQRTPFAELEKRTVFTDPSVFDADLIPDEIFVRKEFDPVVQFHFECLKFQLQQALVIVGPTGSGKTLAARYYGREALRYAQGKDIPIQLVYLNCREIASPYALWQQLLRNLGTIAPKGLSITDLLEKFTEAVRDSRHLVITLDEVEKLFSTLGSDKANSILYVLARLRSNRDLDSAISLILISNSAHLLDLLEAPVRSSLNVRGLTIPSYSPTELVGILRNRANDGFRKGVWSQGILGHVAAKTVQFNSDARFAIRLLRNAAADAEQRGQKRITGESVDRSFETTRVEIERSLLARLAPSQLSVLLALARAAKGSRGDLLVVHSVYRDVYRSLCEDQGRRPLVYSQFLSIIRGLQSHDLVNNHVERRRSGGFIRLVETNFDPKTLETVAGEAL